MVRDWEGDVMLKARCCELAFVAKTRSDFSLGNAKLLLFVVRVCIISWRADGLNNSLQVYVHNVVILDTPEHAAFCSARCRDMPLYVCAYTSNSRLRKHTRVGTL